MTDKAKSTTEFVITDSVVSNDEILVTTNTITNSISNTVFGTLKRIKINNLFNYSNCYIISNSSYTLSNNDNGNYLLFTNSNNITISTSNLLSEKFNTRCIQYGNGTLTISASSNTVILSKSNLVSTSLQYSYIDIYSPSNGTFILFGDLV